MQCIICRKFADKYEIHDEVQNNINKLQETYNLQCLRIIICWAGFTKSQIATINEHNKKHVKDPVLLICPTSEQTGKKLYTNDVYAFLSRTMNPYSKSTAGSKTFNLNDLITAFESDSDKSDSDDSDYEEETPPKKKFKISSTKLQKMEESASDESDSEKETPSKNFKKSEEKVESSKKRVNVKNKSKKSERSNQCTVLVNLILL